MKKIKKLEFVELSAEEQKELYGGCSCIGVEYNFNNIYCCGNGDKVASVFCPGSTSGSGNNGGGNYGGGEKPSGAETCNNCSSHCMPGDNADFANWIGTKLSNQWF